MILQRVEELTKEEVHKLKSAYENEKNAAKEILIIKKEIALSHDMCEEHWMEWGTVVKFDGKFILLYHQSRET